MKAVGGDGVPPKAATAITEPGRHADGGGLYLVVGAGASRNMGRGGTAGPRSGLSMADLKLRFAPRIGKAKRIGGT